MESSPQTPKRKHTFYREPTEHHGNTFKPSPVLCPRCNGDTRVLITPKTKRVRGIECCECPWNHYPETATIPGSDPPETLAHRRKRPYNPEISEA